jgi:hypothetical protein
MEWMVLGGLHVADRLYGDRCTYPTLLSTFTDLLSDSQRLSASLRKLLFDSKSRSCSAGSEARSTQFSHLQPLASSLYLNWYASG